MRIHGDKAKSMQSTKGRKEWQVRRRAARASETSRNRRMPWRPLAAASICASLLALYVTAPAFGATAGYIGSQESNPGPPVFVIGDASGSGAGEFGDGGAFASNYGDTAIDQSTGDIYVIDPINNRVQKLSASGDFILMFGKGVNGSSSAADANVCTAASGDPCQAGTAGAAPGFTEPTGIVVDNSGGPSAGTVYVSDSGNNLIQKYSSSGTYLGSLDGSGSPNGVFQQLPDHGGVAVDGSGNIWTVDSITGNVDKFNPDGSWAGVEWNDAATTWAGIDWASGRRRTSSIAVNPAGTKVYLGKGLCTFDWAPDSCSHDVESWNSDGSGQREIFPMSTGETPPPSILVDPRNGDVYVNNGTKVAVFDAEDNPLFEMGSITATVTYGSSNGSINTTTGVYYSPSSYWHKIFGLPPIVVPTVSTAPVTNPTSTSVTLNGHVDPAGAGDITACEFQWGTSKSYGNTLECDPGTPLSSATDVSADLDSLTPETTYHYRLVATNANGTSTSPDRTFTPHRVVALSTDPASPVGPTSATLNGSWQGNGTQVHYYFEWGTDTSYGNTTEVPPGEDGGSGSGSVSVSAPINGLDPFTTYHYRIVATSSAGTSFGADRAFTTRRDAPHVTVWVTDVHADSALLHVRVNPAGALTSYHFEWGPDDSYGTEVPQPDGQVFDALNPQDFTTLLNGLDPGTTYHFTVVATNSNGTTVLPDHTFTTFPQVPTIKDICPNAHERQQTGAALLLDCRAYELVSAQRTGGHDVESSLVPGQTPFGGYPLASGPSRVLYGVHKGSIPGVAGQPTNFGVDPYVATRGSDGWTTRYVGLPANGTPDDGAFGSPLADANSSLTTFAFGGANLCSPCFADGSTGIPVRLPDGGLVQGMAGSLNPSGATQSGYIGKPLSADGTHLVFGSTAQFEPQGNDEGSVTIYDRDLLAGVTHVASKTPGGQTLKGLDIGELDISADGSRILFGQTLTTDAEFNRYWHLYMNVGASSTSADLTPGPNVGALYAGMSADGSKVFFATPDKLLAEDTDTSSDLYEADVAANGNVTLSLVSVGPSGPSNSDACNPEAGATGPRWNLLGTAGTCNVLPLPGGAGVAAGDGTVYFLSPETLDGSGDPGAPNLFVKRPGEAPHFVATLEADNPLVRHALTDNEVRDTKDFQLTASGDFAAFASTRSLTGYDNDGHSEVFRYSAPDDQIDCASCPPTNARATGDASMASRGLSLSEAGQVFFNSTEPVAPRDLDGVADVYEWEDGTSQLISTGASQFASSLLSASADGVDVYFFTRDALAKQDENGSLVRIYDARAFGGFAYDPPPVPCQASDECHGPSSQAPAAPKMGTLHGTLGNVTSSASPKKPKRCRRGFVKRHGRCVKRKKRHHAKHRKHHRKRHRHTTRRHG